MSEGPMINRKNTTPEPLPPEPGAHPPLVQVGQQPFTTWENGVPTVRDQEITTPFTIHTENVHFVNCRFAGPITMNGDTDVQDSTIHPDTVSQPVGTFRKVGPVAEGTFRIAEQLQTAAEQVLMHDVGEAQVSPNFFSRSYFTLTDQDGTDFLVLVVRGETDQMRSEL